MKLKEILTDWKHYFGWGISTVAVGLFLKYAVGFCICGDVINIFYLYLVIATVDAIKHLIKLQ